ncbi:MAG: universal stress protein [Armatimonadota bacterium]|jgi:nucleotide-binding universal stress UspA family protein
MVRNIVVGYDGSRSSEVAVEQAMHLAELGGGRLYLATVATVTEADLNPEAPGAGPDLAEMALEPPARTAEDDDREAMEQPLSVDEIHRRCQDLHIVCEDERLFGRHPGARLLRRSWFAELLVVGRGDERRPGRLGPNTTFLLTELVAPTLVCARQYVEVRSVLVPYKLSVRGGRALSFAARLCETLNAELEVLICEPRRTDAHEARETAEKFLRGYHVESSTDVSLTPPHEAVRSAAMDRDSSLVVIPGAHKRNYIFPWQRNETLWRALEVPGAAVLAYP